jgi:hypothetical protein
MQQSLRPGLGPKDLEMPQRPAPGNAAVLQARLSDPTDALMRLKRSLGDHMIRM